MIQKSAIVAVLVALLTGCGSSETVSGPLPDAPATMKLGGAGLDGGELPAGLTCDGEGLTPSLELSSVPPKTKALALLVEDPDAPGGSYVHWSQFNAPPRAGGFGRDVGEQGRNSAGKTGWEPPCPPKGGKPHHYVFAAYALKQPLRLGAGAAPAIVRQGIRDNAIAKGTLTATYGR